MPRRRIIFYKERHLGRDFRHFLSDRSHRCGILELKRCSARDHEHSEMTNETRMHRDVGVIALLFTALGSIIGSGWLFGAWRAAQLPGPGAVYAWLIGAVVILFVALTFAELGAMFPESGGSIRYGFYSHGSLVGFVAGWATWIAIVSVIPVEAEASVQYMSSWTWSWAHDLYVQ